jgi:hypothetical protein
VMTTSLIQRNADRPAEAVVLFRLDMSHAEQLIRPFTMVAPAMQEGLAFRSKGSIGVVRRRGERASPNRPFGFGRIRGSSW